MSSWDAMKKVREEEFFVREESGIREKYREKIKQEHFAKKEALQNLKDFDRGYSPVTGGAMFQAVVAGEPVLDCPEEETMLMTYSTLKRILEASKMSDESYYNSWQAFMAAHEVQSK